MNENSDRAACLNVQQFFLFLKEKEQLLHSERVSVSEDEKKEKKQQVEKQKQ